MRILKCTFILVLFPLLIFGQDARQLIERADSILWDNAYERVDSLLRIADRKLKESDDVDLRRYYYVTLGDLKLELQQHPDAVKAYRHLWDVDKPGSDVREFLYAKAINDLGIAYYHVGKMDSAVMAHERSMVLYGNDVKGLFYNFNNLAVIAKQAGKYDTALDYLEQAETTMQKDPDTLGLGFVNLNKGNIYYQTGKPIAAIDHYLTARRLLLAIDRVQHAATAEGLLGKAYSSIRDYAMAMRHFRRAERYYINEERPRSLGDVYSYISEMYRQRRMPDSARLYTMRSLEQYIPIDNTHGIADANLVLGELKMESGQTDSAEVYLKRAIELSHDLYRGTEGHATLGLAAIGLKQNDYQKAFTLAQQAGSIAETFPEKERIEQLRILYQASKGMGRSEEAIGYLEQMAAERDSLLDRERAMEIARLEYQDQILSRDEAEKRRELIYKQESARNRWYLISAIGALVLLSLLAYSLYRAGINKKRDNAALSRQNNEIAAYNHKLEEKNREIADKNNELHHKNTELKELHDKERKHQEHEKNLMEESMAIKERELAATMMVTHEKNTILSDLEKQLQDLQKVAGELRPQVENLRRSVAGHLNMKDSWDSFLHQFETVHPRFFKNLKDTYPTLTLNELKLCAYIKVGMSNKEIAQVTTVAHSSVKKNINRLKKKLGLAPEDKVRDYLIFEISEG